MLHCGYDAAGARLLMLEMAEVLSLELVKLGVAAGSVTLSLGYSFSANVPPARGSMTLEKPTSSTKKLMEYTGELYDRVAVRCAGVFRLNICFGKLTRQEHLQYDMFSAMEAQERERRLQRAVIDIKAKYGKNGIFKGFNLLEGAKTLERNAQIGGHRA